MSHDNEAWAEAQRRRWMKPNAHMWVRPDAYRFMAPGAPRLIGKDAVGYFWPLRRSTQEALEHKYSRDQPRVSAGNPEGGQWTSGNGTPNFSLLAFDLENELQDGLIQLAQFDGSITDADGISYYRPGGHHEMPKGVYSNWELAPETKLILDQSTTGSLPRGTVMTTPEGIPYGNTWIDSHRSYNAAVQELSNQFLQRNNIDPSQMTPTQAQALLKEIRESPDARIRDFNANMRLLQRLSPFRRARGRE